MLTWGAKYFFGVAVFAWLGAIIHGLVTGGSIVGVISMGYKGGVGEHFGYTMLVAVGFCSIILGIIAIVARDGNAEDMSVLAGTDRTIQLRPATGGSLWPALAAFGVGCLAVGFSVTRWFVYLGAAVLAVVLLQWAVQAWAERSTGDAETNVAVYDRLVGPLEVPLLAMLIIAAVVVAVSRILLAVSEAGAVVVGVVVAVFIFGGAVLMAKGKLPRQITTAIIAVGALGILVGGVVGAIAGERDFHHGEETEHSDEG